ncbi:MAG: aminoglycoside phosphotransferase family protein [Geitlerinemataceae cyanobacterium]
MNMLDNLVTIANLFIQQTQIADIRPFGSGNINDTFRVTLDSSTEQSLILQQINTQVFRTPKLVMHNMRVCTEHMRSRLQDFPLDRRWEVPRIFLTKKGQDHFIDADGNFWRAMSLIEDTESFDVMGDVERAIEVGYALGTFHNLVSDLLPETLSDTLEGFHITPCYLQQYEKVLAKTTPIQTPEANYCLQFVNDRASWSYILEKAKAQGKLPLRLMHGDPKLNNILFDTKTGKAVSLIDLDTVKPGLVQYDIGDCLRSGCNPAGEETEDWDSVYFETDLCRNILQGYFSVARAFLTENDYLYLYDAIRLMAFELGLRFLTDYLAGNVYFKVKYPEHNLARAIVQFKLTESIEAQEALISNMIRDSI